MGPHKAYSKFLKITPNGLSVILVKFEDHRSHASPEMIFSGKHGILTQNSVVIKPVIPA